MSALTKAPVKARADTKTLRHEQEEGRGAPGLTAPKEAAGLPNAHGVADGCQHRLSQEPLVGGAFWVEIRDEVEELVQRGARIEPRGRHALAKSLDTIPRHRHVSVMTCLRSGAWLSRPVPWQRAHRSKTVRVTY